MGERSVGGKAVPSLTHHGCAGNTPARGLEPDKSATGRGNANRAAAVAAFRDRTHSGSDRARSPAARTTGGMRQFPWIARGRAETTLSSGTAAKFRRGSFAQQDAPGLAQANGVFLICAGNKMLEVFGAEGGADARCP